MQIEFGGPLAGFAIIISFLIAFFVYWCNDCGKPDTGEYKQWCRVCYNNDVCKERWEKEGKEHFV